MEELTIRLQAIRDVSFKMIQDVDHEGELDLYGPLYITKAICNLTDAIVTLGLIEIEKS